MKLDVTLEDYKRLISIGLTLDSLFILQLLDQDKNVKLPERAMASVGILRIKGYFDEEKGITDKGKGLLGKVELPVDVPDSRITATQIFAKGLHKELQDKLMALTGKKQKVLQGKYSFLCNVTDLETKLVEVRKKYGMSRPNDVRLLLLKYVDRCHKAGWDKVMLVEYYIMKNGTSKLMTDLDNTEDTSPDVELSKPLIDPKSMF